MAYASGYGFGNGNKTKEKSLVEIPKLRDLAQLVAPEAIEDEWGVMSCILTSQKPQDVYLKVANILEPKHFGLPMLQDIWRIMVRMHQQHLPVAYSVLQCHLQDTYEKNQEFFQEFLPRMYESAHDEEHVTIYAKRILSKYHKRTLIGACSEGINAAVQHMEPSDALAELERRISEVRQEIHNKNKKSGSSFRSLLNNYVADLNDQAEGKKPSGTIKTGSWYDFNEAAQGFAPGDFIVIAAPTSCGKSMTGISLAREFALEGHTVMYASLEMTQQTVVERVMSPVLGFSAGAMSRSGTISDEKLESIRKFQEEYANLPIAIKKPHQNSYDSFQKSIAEAEAEFREDMGDDFTGFRVVIVDYLQLLAANVPSQFKVQEIDKAAQLLRNYALENNCTVIALAQYDTETAKAAGKEPDSLNCLSYCKTIDHHATQVVMMHHPNFGDRKKLHDAAYIDFLWMKNRDGSNGRVRMGVDWQKGWLFSIASGGKRKFEQAPITQNDPWKSLTEKYGTSSKKSKQLAEDAHPEIIIDLPAVEESLVSLAMPKGADAALAEQMETIDLDYQEEEEDEVIEMIAEEPLAAPESATAVADVTINVEATEAATEYISGGSESIEINGEMYEIGEEAQFNTGKGVLCPVTIVGVGDYGSIKVKHLDTVRWDDQTREYSGKEFKWYVGKINDAVHPTRIFKKLRSTSLRSDS